jgi:hypothetical protein
MAASDLVDIIFTITGRSKPPTLPLREELNSNGFETVYNGKGFTESVEHKAGFEDEKSLIGVSSKSSEQDDSLSPGFKNQMSSVRSTHHDVIGDDISKILGHMYIDESISSSDVSGDSFILDSNLIKEQIESDRHPGNVVVENRSSSGKKKKEFEFDESESTDSDDDTIISVKREQVNVDTRFDKTKAKEPTPGIGSITYYYTSPDAEGPTKTKTVRFKNVKPTTEEAIEKCRALTKQVRIMQLSFSIENNSTDSSNISSDEEFEAIIAKASHDEMLDRLLGFTVDADMDESRHSALTDGQFDDDSTTASCESTVEKIPVTKCQILAEKRAEFRKNVRNLGIVEDGNQILYKGHQRSYE